MTAVKDQYEHPIKQVCKALNKSPQAYYKYLKSDTPLRESELEFIVISYIVEARKSNPGIGGVSLWMQYCREWGARYPVGRDKFVSYIRKHKLYVRIPRRYKAPRTTDSNHDQPTYPNLVRDLIPDGPNQVWSSDITYIPLERGDNRVEFCFLSLILDNYTKEIVGYSLGDSLASEYPCEALKQALKRIPQKDASDLIHHSDRGTQYASRQYTKMLNKRGIQISMTESGDPKEKSQSERINSTTKNEFLKGKVFRSIDEANRAISKAIETYNTIRPHMSIDYMTPQEARECTGPLKKRWRSYREDAIQKARKDKESKELVTS